MEALSIEIVDCASRYFAYLPRHGTIHSLNSVAAATPVWGTTADRGLPRTGWLIGCFPDAPGEAIFEEPAPELRIGPEVSEPFEDDLSLRCAATPAGRAASASYRGVHEESPKVHRAIRAWCAANGHQLAGPIWESYRWNTDPTLRVIEVYYLLA
jgi:hypothetical protein